MPAILKGTAKITIPADAKPGDEIEVKGVSFEADQDDYERSLRQRLDQQKRQHTLDIEAKETQIKELKAKLPVEGAGNNAPVPDPAVANKIAALEKDLAESKLQQRIDAQLKKSGLAEIPTVFRNSLKLAANASDAEVEDAVKALSEDGDLKKLMAKDTTTEDPKKPRNPTPRPGGGGSQDPKDKISTLAEKARLNAPQYHAMLAGMEAEQQLEVLESWDAQGVLSPKKV